MSHNFFHVLSVEEVVQKLSALAPLPAENALLFAADGLEGRALAEDVLARDDVPLTSRSGMDGYAVRAADTFGASESNPAYLTCVARHAIDQQPDCVLEPGQCAGIVTGGIVPEGADAVVMVEHTHCMAEGGDCVEIRKAVPPGEYLMLRGEDAREGTVALPAGTALRAQEIGLLAAVGVTAVRVHGRPVVAILSTGDEVLPVDSDLRPGQVRDVNSHALAALVRRAGGIPLLLGIARDTLEDLEAGLRKGMEQADMLLLSGGSSVGVRDLTVAALERLGSADIFCHGVAISPGKPLILATAPRPAAANAPSTEDATPAATSPPATSSSCVIWGLPGQVASAQVVMMVLGQPFIRHLAGHADAFSQQLWPRCRAELARNVASRQGREDYVRIRLEPREGELPLAVPVPGMSGLLRTLIQSQGVMRIPASLEGFEQGREVDVLLF